MTGGKSQKLQYSDYSILDNNHIANKEIKYDLTKIL